MKQKKDSRNLAVAKENPNTQPIESLSDSKIYPKAEYVNYKYRELWSTSN